MNRKVLTSIIFVIAIFALVRILSSSIKKNTLSPAPLNESVNTTGSSDIETGCDGSPTVSQTEGPYYTPASPEKSDLYSDVTSGEKLTLTGIVYDVNCDPVARAWLDFWHADENGVYDNQGYTLRGHQFTDEIGKYTLVTQLPGKYTGRTEHIHVKVAKSQDLPILTTQLYFPNSNSNTEDNIFMESLLLRNFTKTEAGWSAKFNFVLAN